MKTGTTFLSEGLRTSCIPLPSLYPEVRLYEGGGKGPYVGREILYPSSRDSVREYEIRSRGSVCSGGFLRIGTGVDCYCSDVEFVMSGYGTAIDYLFPVLAAVDPGYRTGRGGMPRSAASFPGAVTSG